MNLQDFIDNDVLNDPAVAAGMLFDLHWTIVEASYEDGDDTFTVDCKCGYKRSHSGGTDAHQRAEQDRHEHLFEAAINDRDEEIDENISEFFDRLRYTEEKFEVREFRGKPVGFCLICDYTEGPFETRSFARQYMQSHLSEQHAHTREEPVSDEETRRDADALIDAQTPPADAQGSSQRVRDEGIERIIDALRDHRWELFTEQELGHIEYALSSKLEQRARYMTSLDPSVDERMRNMIREVATNLDRRDITRDPR